MTEYIILGFLMERKMTGYDIKLHMGMSTSYFADASFGSIYPSLKRLVQKELIVSEEVVENGKLKKIYALNDQGREEFKRWLAAPIEATKSGFAPALTKIFFYSHLPKEQARELIRNYIGDIQEFKNGLIQLRTKVESLADDFALGTLDFGLDFYDFVIGWFGDYLDKMIRTE